MDSPEAEPKKVETASAEALYAGSCSLITPAGRDEDGLIKPKDRRMIRVRGQNGQFKPAKRSSVSKLPVRELRRPGDTKKYSNQELKEAILDEITAADIREIVAVQVDRAIGGSQEAATFIFDRLFGKPVSPALVGGHINHAALDDDAQKIVDWLSGTVARPVETKVLPPQAEAESEESP
jgi:hypothetical protein